MSDMRKFLNAVQLNEDEDPIVHTTGDALEPFDLTKLSDSEILALEPGVIDDIRKKSKDYNVSNLTTRQRDSLQKRYKEVVKSGIRKGEGQSFNGKNNSSRKSPDKRETDPEMFNAIKKLHWVAMDSNSFDEIRNKYDFKEVHAPVKKSRKSKADINDEGQIQQAYDLKKETGTESFFRKYAPKDGSVHVWRADVLSDHVSDEDFSDMVNDGFTEKEVKGKKGDAPLYYLQLTVVELPNRAEDDTVDTRVKYVHPDDYDPSSSKVPPSDKLLIKQGYQADGKGYYTKTITVPKPKNKEENNALLAKYKKRKSGPLAALSTPKIVDKGENYEITLKEPSRSMRRSLENEIVNRKTTNQEGGFGDESTDIENAGEQSLQSDAAGKYDANIPNEKAGSFLKRRVGIARNEYPNGGKDHDSINTMLNIVRDPEVSPVEADEAYDKLWKLTVGMCTSSLRHKKGITEDTYADLIQVFSESLYYAAFTYKEGKANFATYIYNVFEKALKNFNHENSSLASAGRGSSKAAKAFFSLIDKADELSMNDPKGEWSQYEKERYVCNEMDKNSENEFKIGPQSKDPSREDYHDAFLKAEQKFSWAGFSQGISDGNEEQDENGNFVPSGAILSANSPPTDSEEEDKGRAEYSDNANAFIAGLVKYNLYNPKIKKDDKFTNQDAKWLVYGLGLRGPEVKRLFGAESDNVYTGSELSNKLGEKNVARRKDLALKKLAKSLARLELSKKKSFSFDNEGNQLSDEEKEQMVDQVAETKFNEINEVLNILSSQNRSSSDEVRNSDWESEREKNSGLSNATKERSTVSDTQAQKLLKNFPFLKNRAQQLQNAVNDKAKIENKLQQVKNEHPEVYDRIQELKAEIEHVKHGRSVKQLKDEELAEFINLQTELLKLRDEFDLSSAEDSSMAKEAIRAIQNVVKSKREFTSPDKEKVEPNEPVMPYSVMDPVTNKPTRNASHAFNDEINKDSISKETARINAQIKQNSPEDYSKLKSAEEFVNKLRDLDNKVTDYSISDARAMQDAYKTMRNIYAKFNASPEIIEFYDKNIASASGLVQHKLSLANNIGSEDKAYEQMSRIENEVSKIDVDRINELEGLDDETLQTLGKAYTALVRLYAVYRDKTDTRDCKRKLDLVNEEIQKRNERFKKDNKVAQKDASDNNVDISGQDKDVNVNAEDLEVRAEHDAIIKAEVAINNLKDFKDFNELDIAQLNRIRDIFVKLGKEYPDFVKSPNIRKIFNKFIAAYKSKAQ